MKLALALLAATGLAIFGFWFGWVRAPSPEAICDHKVAMVRAEADGRDADALIERLRETCVDNANRWIQFRGKVRYAEYARCVLAASDLEGSERCPPSKASATAAGGTQ